MIRGRRSRDRRRQRGFALFVVLWFLVLLAAIGVYMLTAARSQLALARNVVAGAKAEALAEAGVADAVFKLTEPLDTAQWLPDGSAHSVRLPGGTLTIRVADESAKINLNLASAAQINGLFQALGTDPGQAAAIANAIAAWVGTVKPTGQAATLVNQYHEAGLAYEPPQAGATNLEELRFVLGMTPQLFALMQPYVTVYTTAAAPDPATASPIIQKALAYAAAVAPAADATPPQGQPAGGTAPAATPPSPPGAAPASAPGAAPAGVGGAGTVLTASIDVLARGREGGVFAVHTVVRVDPGSPKGYKTLDWERADAGS